MYNKNLSQRNYSIILNIRPSVQRKNANFLVKIWYGGLNPFSEQSSDL